MLRSSLHQRAESLQGSPDVSLPSSSNTKLHPFSFMKRNVSWDPTVTVIEEPKVRQTPRQVYTCPSSPHSRRTEATVHPLLATETNAIFDARLAPAKPSSEVEEPATSNGARHLRVVSRDFPWTLEISNRKQSVLTCADVFSAIYVGLSVPLTRSEWTLADQTRKSSIIRANRNRRGGSVSVGRLRRIDWLGSRVYFNGLTKDDALGSERLLPGSDDDLCPDTWVIKFGSR